MTVEAYQDESSNLWGYIISDQQQAISTSAALYDNERQAKQAAYEKLEDADYFIWKSIYFFMLQAHNSTIN